MVSAVTVGCSSGVAVHFDCYKLCKPSLISASKNISRISRFGISQLDTSYSLLSPHDEGGFFDFADNGGGYPARQLAAANPLQYPITSLAAVDLDTLRYLSKQYWHGV